MNESKVGIREKDDRIVMLLLSSTTEVSQSCKHERTAQEGTESENGHEQREAHYASYSLFTQTPTVKKRTTSINHPYSDGSFPICLP